MVLMGNEEKQSLFNKVKASVGSAAAQASAAAKEGFEDAADGVIAGAKFVGEKAGDLKEVVDAKTRSLLDEAHGERRPAALANVARIREAHPSLTPGEILQVLEDELGSAEVLQGTDSDEFSEALALFVLTAVEIHGTEGKDPAKIQRLVDTVLILDSDVVRFIANNGGLALELIAGRVSTAGKLAKNVAKVSAKAGKYKKFAKLLGMKDVGKQSFTWLAVNAHRQMLGNPPENFDHLAA